MNSQMLAAALDYVAHGWQVLPCKWTGTTAKAPLIAGGYRSATTDPDTIRRWWQHWPLALVGLVPPRGLVALDIDPRNGGTLQALEDLNGRPLPETAYVRTGSGGLHLYYRTGLDRMTGHLRGQNGTALAGIDVKHGGTGYLIAPPSLHPETGKAYEWHGGAIAALPRPLESAITPRSGRVSSASAKMSQKATARERNGAFALIARYEANTREGNRNCALFSLACKFWTERQGWDVFEALRVAGLEVGLDAGEIDRTIDSAREHVGVAS
ncbi:bifunctional DNA primase/polymerase [Pauljensenia sp. UMB0895]|uniref:bifunctional DNA primase/polymerase n=1 Tax=Pauljensenia sp. UMB0895 TaxID=3046319 RepID=UPI00254D3B32|nr:bifunctional DNA primase/polymerase [Pauljensenia sp. UMB0895]MDK7338777.1 bifunctional DNA primase/polymerase [Pauljensenia sp. UMB0895]